MPATRQRWQEAGRLVLLPVPLLVPPPVPLQVPPPVLLEPRRLTPR